jgi:hypothetical protein
MAKSSPERLAAALRANLKRRKGGQGSPAAATDAQGTAKRPEKAPVPEPAVKPARPQD